MFEKLADVRTFWHGDMDAGFAIECDGREVFLIPERHSERVGGASKRCHE